MRVHTPVLAVLAPCTMLCLVVAQDQPRTGAGADIP